VQNERAVLPCELPDVLGDGDLRLRSLTGDDWTLEHQMSRVPDIVEWTTLRPDLSVEQAKERVGGAAQWRRDAAGAVYVIERDGHVVGTAGLTARDDGQIELFYGLLPQGRGRGSASKAARLLADWADHAGVGRVILTTYPGNAASQRTATRAGFQHVGSERRTVKDNVVELLVWARPTTSVPASSTADPA